MSQSFPLCSHNIWLAGVCCCRPPPHLLMMMSSLPVSQAPHSSLGFSKLTSASVQSSALHALEHRMGRADAGVYIKTVVSFHCVLVPCCLGFVKFAHTSSIISSVLSLPQKGLSGGGGLHSFPYSPQAYPV